MTRPNGAVVPPFVRIDHVLTGARLAVTQITTGPGSGSDHRYLPAARRHPALNPPTSGIAGILCSARSA